MARKYSRSKRRIRKNKRRNRSGGWFWFQFFIIFIFCSAAYIMWLDQRIRVEFEGKRWSLPARVYARPLELYPGMKTSPDILEQELRLLGYHKVQRPVNAGEYSTSRTKLELVSRDFEFWNSKETSRQISLVFNDSQIISITNTGINQPIPLFRLEPLLIGKIYPEHKEDRVLVVYDEVPPSLVDTLIAVEDRHFFGHFGVDPKGILRAIWINLRKGQLEQGGSTITQQLVKNFFLTQERTLWRKFNEVIMSILLEWHYSKSEILSAYINEIYLGQQGPLAIHGFGTAAEYYFARPLKELRQDQLALLAGLVRGASYYNPRRHPERAKNRRDLILALMRDQGYLDESLAAKYMATPLDIAPRPGWSSARYPAFLELVRRQLQQDYKAEDLRTEGLLIFTTLDPRYQNIAESTVQKQLIAIEEKSKIKQNTVEAAGVITSIETGEVLALVGGRENDYTGFNRALDAHRPIGSLIKPVVYLTALSDPSRYNVMTVLKDEAINIKQTDGSLWTPKNYDSDMHGDVPLHVALEQSYNLATVYLGLQLGIPRVMSTLRDLGIDGNIPEYPSLFLGSLEMTPLNVAQLYQALASNGFNIPLRTIREVLDKNGNPLQRYELEIKQSVDSRAVFITNFLMTRVVSNGTAKKVSQKLPSLMPLAGKTGTTNELRDSWFAGFGDEILAVIWLGRDDNQPAGLTGASGALQIWSDIMQAIDPAPLSMITPDGIAWVDMVDGHRAVGSCANTESFPFITPYIPEITVQCGMETKPRKSQLDLWPW